MAQKINLSENVSYLSSTKISEWYVIKVAPYMYILTSVDLRVRKHDRTMLDEALLSLFVTDSKEEFSGFSVDSDNE